ncbi:MAG TPA: CmcJ/NvfI family oxidoreductase [Steroidobacteraceae bacterium]|nr:CmcJ/NvfI family oxidoreductase [Steroidobacteraceae bacterium]
MSTTHTLATDRQSDGLEATIRYVVAGEKAVFYPTDRERSYWPAEEHRVRIANLRRHIGELSLERNGFVLLREPSAVRNFYDADEVRRVYYAEIEALVQRLLGAQKVLVFGEIARSDAATVGDGRKPAYGAHVNYGERTVRQFAEDMLGREAAAPWLERRVVLMNLWRPIRTVYRTPLALCDASSVAATDLHDSEVRGGLNDPHRPSLYGYNLSYSPRHRWYYVPRMEPDEILAFKLFDSDRARVQWTGHTAFDDPTAPADAPPRESIEIRTISFIT